MVRKDREMEAAVEIGRKNARLWPQVQRWCRHLKIEQVTAGLLASAYRLPIGTLRIVCPHGISQSESMHLDWEATSFVLSNCIGCAHHSELHPDNYGRTILQKKKEADAKEQELWDRRERLRQESLETARQALESSEITEKSVNSLILEAQSDTEQAHRVREQLIEAARIAPEMFSENALQVIADNFTVPSAPIYIRCATELCRSRQNVPDFVLTAALNVVDVGPIEAADSACLLLDLHARISGISTLQSQLPSLLQILDRRTPRWLTHDNLAGSDIPGIIAVLRTCMDADPDLVLAQFRSRLAIDREDSRLSTAEILTTLLPDYPEQILSLLPELLTSLDLADDPYVASADHATCDILAHLYIYSPTKVEEAIGERWQRASDEVRKPLLRIYELIARHASHKDRFSAPVFPKDSYKQHLLRVVERVYLALGDIQLSVTLRQEACRILKELAEEWPDLLAVYIPRLLGRLRMTVQESKNIPQKGANILETLQLGSGKIGYDALITRVGGVLRTLFKANPRGTWHEVVSFLNDLDSRQDATLKAELVGSISEFIADYSLLPEVIPELYKHLVDYESNLVRYKAISVLGQLLRNDRPSVPESMIDLVVEVHLRDPYKIIHKAAAASLGSYKFTENRRGYMALEALKELEKIYFEEGMDTRFLEELVHVFRSAFAGWVEVRRYVALSILPRYARHPDPYFSEHMITMLSYDVQDFPEVSRLFLQVVLDFFQRTERDRYNYDGYSKRTRLWTDLEKLPAEIVSSEYEKFAAVIKAKALSDPVEAYRFISTFSALELHQQAAELAELADEALPSVKAHAWWKETFNRAAAAERAESLLAAGDRTGALRVLGDVE